MDRKQDTKSLHLLDGTVYASSTNTASIDMAKFDQAKLELALSAVATSPVVFTIQDSADGVTFVNTAHTTSLAAGVAAGTRAIWIRAQDVRRHVRLNVNPGGTVTMGASATMMGATSPPAATPYLLDTSA